MSNPVLMIEARKYNPTPGDVTSLPKFDRMLGTLRQVDSTSSASLSILDTQFKIDPYRWQIFYNSSLLTAQIVMSPDRINIKAVTQETLGLVSLTFLNLGCKTIIRPDDLSQINTFRLGEQNVDALALWPALV